MDNDGPIEELNKKAPDLLKFQINRKFVHLTKSVLNHLENLRNSNELSPQDYLELRKIILDNSNDGQRELNTQIDHLSIKWK